VLVRVVVVYTPYVCDTFDRSVRCKLVLSAGLVGTGELWSGQSSSDRSKVVDDVSTNADDGSTNAAAQDR